VCEISLGELKKKALAIVIGKNFVCAFCVIKKRAFEDDLEKKRAFSGVLGSVVSLSSFS
jgi:hypothetical protein